MRSEGSAWSLDRVRLRCAHGAAVLACNDARLELNDCVLGGEGEDEMGKHVMLSAYGSVQVQGLAKRACYAMVLRDHAAAIVSHCTMRQCSEAAVLIAHRSRAILEGCHILDCTAAFIAGHGRGRALELWHCTIERTARKLWADADRPLAFEWGKGNSREEATDASDDAVGDESIVPREQPRGAAGDSSSDTDSLEDATAFANMEALMEELDNAALAS